MRAALLGPDKDECHSLQPRGSVRRVSSLVAFIAGEIEEA